ncbi:MAG: hypothetical protein HRU20_20835 [Pseudomonadales bacterium]|nr:hypothetical protein [Pseudomonadales bacterium]
MGAGEVTTSIGGSSAMIQQQDGKLVVAESIWRGITPNSIKFDVQSGDVV